MSHFRNQRHNLIKSKEILITDIFDSTNLYIAHYFHNASTFFHLIQVNQIFLVNTAVTPVEKSL